MPFKPSLFSYRQFQGSASVVFLFVICLCHTTMSVSYSLDDTCWEKANVLAYLYVMFYLVFVTFPYAVLSQVWYMIVTFLIFGFFLACLMKKYLNERAIS